MAYRRRMNLSNTPPNLLVESSGQVHQGLHHSGLVAQASTTATVPNILQEDSGSQPLFRDPRPQGPQLRKPVTYGCSAAPTPIAPQVDSSAQIPSLLQSTFHSHMSLYHPESQPVLSSDDLTRRFAAVIEPLVTTQQQRTSDRLDKIDDAILSLANVMASARKDTEAQTNQMLQVLEKSHSAQQSIDRALVSRVEAIEKLFGTIADRGGSKSLLEHPDLASLSIEGPLECARDPDLLEPPVRHEQGTNTVAKTYVDVALDAQIFPDPPWIFPTTLGVTEKLYADAGVDPGMPDPPLQVAPITRHEVGTSVIQGSYAGAAADARTPEPLSPTRQFTSIDAITSLHQGTSPSLQRASSDLTVVGDATVTTPLSHRLPSLDGVELNGRGVGDALPAVDNPIGTTNRAKGVFESRFASLSPMHQSFSPVDWSRRGSNQNFPIDPDPKQAVFYPDPSPQAREKYTVLQNRIMSPDGTIASLRQSALGDSAVGHTETIAVRPPSPYYSRPSVSPLPSPAPSLFLPDSRSPTPELVAEPVLEPVDDDDMNEPISISDIESSPPKTSNPATTAKLLILPSSSGEWDEISGMITKDASSIAGSPQVLTVLAHAAHTESFPLPPHPQYKTGPHSRPVNKKLSKSPASPIYVGSSFDPDLSKELSPMSVLSDDIDVVPAKKLKLPRVKLTTSDETSLLKKALKPRPAGGQTPSAAATRVKKRKLKALEVGPEPPLKRARRRVPVKKEALSTPAMRRRRSGKANWPTISNGAEFDKFIECDVCSFWYHYGCVGVVRGDIRLEPTEIFTCPPCMVAGDNVPDRRSARGSSSACGRPDCNQDETLDEFFVSGIIGRTSKIESGRGRRSYWLVKWDGYPVTRATWEGEDTMADPAKLIEEFNKTACKEGLSLDYGSTVLLREAVIGGWTDPNA